MDDRIYIDNTPEIIFGDGGGLDYDSINGRLIK